MHQNDLFQRVVGFRHPIEACDFFDTLAPFPSLSESSGFPTLSTCTIFTIKDTASFHLFQRVVGFRQLIVTVQALQYRFSSFHLFQRVVGFRLYRSTSVY